MRVINRNNLQEISRKLDINSKDIKKAKVKSFLKKLQFPFIQLGVALLSFVANFFPYKWYYGRWEPTYPTDYMLDFFFVLLNPFHWVLHLGNLTGSLLLNKRLGMRKALVTIVVISNYILSALAFFLIHKITSVSISESLAGTGMAIEYGVFKKKHYKKKLLNLCKGAINVQS